jgi:hypothetical protein
MTGSICIWHCAEDRGAGRLIMEGELSRIVEPVPEMEINKLTTRLSGSVVLVVFALACSDSKLRG